MTEGGWDMGPVGAIKRAELGGIGNGHFGVNECYERFLILGEYSFSKEDRNCLHFQSSDFSRFGFLIKICLSTN